MEPVSFKVTHPADRRLVLHGRRRGPRLRPHRVSLMASLLPKLEISLPENETASLDPNTLFATEVSDLWLEIGFGGGEHLAAQAAAHPRVGFVGCEPYINGVARLLAEIEATGAANIRILTDDARPLVEALPEACLGRVFILFPDPWPKTRHHKRRFIQAETLNTLSRIMKDGAELRFASDHGGYMRWTLQRLIGHPDFQWTARRAADWRRRPDDWPETRYERKALEQGRRSTYLTFVRRSRNARPAASSERAPSAAATF